MTFHLKMSQYPPNHILPTHNENIFATPANFYIFPTLSVKIGSISIFLSSGKHQSYHLVGCHATVINSLLISFWSALHFSNLLGQTKSDMNNSFGIIFNKINIIKIN